MTALFILRTPEVRRNALLAIQSLPAHPLQEVVIREHKKRRTNPQNAYYWVLVTTLAQWSAETPEDMHELLAYRLLPVRHKELDGKIIALRTSTASLSTREFSAYVDQVQALIQSMGLTVPPPEHFGLESQLSRQP